MTDSDADLKPGIYETPLTVELDSRLAELHGLAPERKRIPKDRVPGALSRVLQQTVRDRLEQTESIADQASLTNAVLQSIAGDTAQIITDDDRAPLELRALSDGNPRYQSRPITSLNESALITNARREESLAHALNSELMTADRVDLLCAFVKWSGMQPIMDTLKALHDARIPVRLLTTTYMGATDAEAIRRLAEEFGFEVKVNYNTSSTRLHAKSWLIYRDSGYHTAFIGSSNLSHAAMVDGLEWNVRVSASTDPRLFRKLADTFETYWLNPVFEDYIPVRDDLRLRQGLNASSAYSQGADLDSAFLDIQPQPHQRIMLEDLEHERRAGHHRNLVVAATGTGKTVLAALDYRNLCGEDPGSKSLLFVAHRKEILRQARRTYAHVLNDANFGEFYVDGDRPTEWRHVFASVASLSPAVLDSLHADQFDVVVIDEFHHADAPTYRRLLDFFEPHELLGLTATPERGDGVNVASMFENRIASELRLWDALDGDLLVPFHYFVHWDDTDLSGIEKTGDEYNSSALEKLYVNNDGRSRYVLEALRKRVLDPADMKALVFCVNVAHAHYMADVLTRAGVPSVALSGQSSRETRDHALRDLKDGKIACLCAVDLFNEGLDIPAIDTVIMLRPTQSATVFLQQLGRGLRRAPGKSVLTLLDFVGHQREDFSFEPRFRALTGLGRHQLTKAVNEGFTELPPGCDIQFERLAKEEVLGNLRRQLKLTTPRLAGELASYAQQSGAPHDYSLQQFLRESDRPLSAVLGRGKASGKSVDWTRLKHIAGLFPEIDESGEAEYLRGRIRAFAHVDDPVRASLYSSLAAPIGPSWDELNKVERVAAEMLFYNVWPEREFKFNGHSRLHSIAGGLAALRKRPWFAEEIEDVMAVSVAQARGVFDEPGGHLARTPLRTHAHYRREELLAAIGIGRDFQSNRVPGGIREGVAWNDETQLGSLLVQLEKDGESFSESTMYEDFAISEDLFHWQSQNATTPHSATGKRLTSPDREGYDIGLFVRERSDDDFGKGAPYTFLGLVDLVSHAGSKPISITWRLRNEMPQALYLAARAVAS